MLRFTALDHNAYWARSDRQADARYIVIGKTADDGTIIRWECHLMQGIGDSYRRRLIGSFPCRVDPDRSRLDAVAYCTEHDNGR